VVLGGSAAASYYVDALWFESLGYASVFWTRLSLQAATFGAFALVTFVVVYGVFRALKPDRLDELVGATILVNRQPVTLPVEPVLKLIGLGLSVAIAAAAGASMMGRWMTLALFWDAPRSATMRDPIFGRPLDFYYAAGCAAHRRMAADTGGHRLHDRCRVRRRHRRRAHLDGAANYRSAD
jgi:uncharacterized membrane protein (UPF0182 family)